MRQILFVLMIGLTMLVTHQQCHAQRRIPRSQTTPTISPYVNLFNANTGGVNNYFNFVRPQLQYNQQMNQFARQSAFNYAYQQQYATQQQIAIQQAVTDQLMLVPRTGMGARAAVAGSYFNYGGFYNRPLTGQASLSGGSTRTPRPSSGAGRSGSSRQY